jgi:predicted nucleic acid-binding protein
LNFVLDASVTLAWIFADESTALTNDLRQQLGSGSKAFVPPLWRWEIGNVLMAAERKNRITAAFASQHLSFLGMLPILIDAPCIEEAWSVSLLLARKHALTVYDAAYLGLSVRRGLPLASLDNPLREAAMKEGVQLLPT